MSQNLQSQGLLQFGPGHLHPPLLILGVDADRHLVDRHFAMLRVAPFRGKSGETDRTGANRLPQFVERDEDFLSRYRFFVAWMHVKVDLAAAHLDVKRSRLSLYGATFNPLHGKVSFGSASARGSSRAEGIVARSQSSGSREGMARGR